MTDPSKLDAIVAQAVKSRDARERDYRAQSLKLHPWVCGRCGRDFTRKNLHELPFITGTTTTTTTPRMAATGKTCVCTAMTTSTPVMLMQSPVLNRPNQPPLLTKGWRALPI